MRTSLALLSVVTGAALAFGGVLTAPAAFADVPTTCFDAQTALTAAKHTLAAARQTDAIDDSGVNGGADFTPDADDQAVAADASAVTIAQQNVNALCGTNGGTGTGLPHPRPVLLNCTQLAARGIHDIPAGNPFYRTALDTNRDGIACETTNTIPIGTYRVVNGQNCHWDGTTWIPVTVVAPPPAVDPCNCAPTPEPQPTQVIIKQQPPVVTQTVVEQPPVYVPPAQVFTNPVAPSIGATSTGDGTMAGRN